MIQQMVVTRNADGSHSPAYDENWAEPIQVEWYAGCIAVDTGLRITVTRGSHIRTALSVPEGDPKTYHVRIQGTNRTSFGNGPFTAQQLYQFLDGVKVGVGATQSS